MPSRGSIEPGDTLYTVADPTRRESRVPPHSRYRARVRGRRATDYLEVCVLNEMCGNHDEIFRVGHGGSFFCAFDAARWAAFGRVLQTM